jgi:ATP-dependent exoDNAse (exonuclease V) beta subunit
MKRWHPVMKKSSQIAALKQKWNESVGDIEAIVENSGIDRRKFNRGNQESGLKKSASGRRKNPGAISFRTRWKIFAAVPD